MAGRFLIQKLSRASRSAETLATGPASAAMCLSTYPCSRAATKTNCKTGVPSIMVNGMQTVFACSVSGSKRAFSSTASSAHEVPVEAKTACSKVGGDNEFVRRQKWLWGFTIGASVLAVVFDELRPSKRSKRASERSKRAGTSRCSSCGKE